MNRKRAAIAVASVSLLATLAGALVWGVKYEPTFYETALADTAPPEIRREQAKEFVQTTMRLVDEIRNEESWSHAFSEEAVNGWLAEELPVKYGEWLPPEIAAPRVKFERGNLLLAFQVRHGMWKGVVSAQVRPWVAAPNQLALEIQSARVGLIPVPVDELLGDFVKHMNTAGLRIQWKNSGKQDVLVVEFDDDFSPSGGSGDHAVLEAVELEPKLLRISGRRSTDSADSPRLADKPVAP
jgi:hypothetical protein